MQNDAMTVAGEDYEIKREEYLRASTTNQAQLLHGQMQVLHNEWSDAQGSASTAVMAAIGVHVVGILHSVLFMPRLRPVVSSGGPTLSLKAGTNAGRATLTLSIKF
jgi:hypothetical protein